MKNVLVSMSAAVLVSLSIACGGGSTGGNGGTPPPPPPPAVSISLTEAAVAMETSNPDYHVTNTHTFTAAVRNATNSSVTWKVNGIPGGDTSTGHGTISTAGVYTAPILVPSDGVTITATSVEDPTKSASAAVNLQWYVDNVYVSTNGTPAEVKTGEQVQINASATTLGPNSVTWDVNGVKVGTAALGALFYLPSWGANTVFYTAPTTSPGTVTIRATSDANPAKSGTIQITVVNSDSSEPSVAISPAEVTLELGKTQQFSATLSNTSGAQWAQMQGDSKLANGIMNSSGLYTAPYEVPTPADVIVSAWANGYSNKYGYAIVHIAPPSVNPNTRLNGSYVIALQDHSYGIDLLGVVTADGNGNLHGTADLNTPFGVATGQAFHGTYSIGSDGRGQATITYTPVAGVNATLTARLMMHSDNLGYFYSADTYLGLGTGVLEKQTTPTFSQASFNGNYAFLLRGAAPVANLNPPPANSTTPTATAGFLHADGTGNITGSSDTSTAGILTTHTISGTYAVQSGGTGTATLNFASSVQPFTSQISIAMVSPEKFYVLSTDDLTVAGATSPLLAGTVELQTGGPFAATSLAGPYVAYDHSTSWMQLMRFDSNGAGTIRNGVTDERDTSGTGAPTVSTNIPFLGSYFVDANGHGQIGVHAFNGDGNAFIYMVSPSKFFILLNEPVPAAGEGYTQAQEAFDFDWSKLDGRYAAEISGTGVDGVGWILPYYGASYPSVWMGWLDYVSTIKNESSFNFNSADSWGTGQMNIGFNNGQGLTWIRYYAVSDSKVLMMSVAPSSESNELIWLGKLDQ